MGELTALYPWLMALVLTVPRMLIAFMVLPMFAQPIFPGMIRNGIVITMSLILLPLTHSQILQIPDLNTMTLLILIVKEGILGLILGYAMAIPFWAMRAAGFIIDLQRGAMSALFFSPALAGMVSPLGAFLGQFAVTMLFVSGGFVILLQTLILSYQTWPVHLFMPEFSVGSTKYFLQQFDMLLYLTLMVAGPFMALNFIIDLGTGLIGRYLPQLNVFLIAMPIKSGITFFVMIFYVGFLANYLSDIFLSFGESLKILDALVG